MKRLFLIATVFCLSLVSLKAEAINDKDFETFFAEFQQEIKGGDLWRFTDLIYEDYKIPKTEDSYNMFEQSVRWFISFYEEFKRDYKYVIKLNKKNNYKAGKGFKSDREDYWEVKKLDSDYAKQLGVLYGYELTHLVNMGEDEGACACIFAKVSVDGGEPEWRVIAVWFVG